MNKTKAIEDLCKYGRFLFDRGLTHGASGNVSCRLDQDGTVAITPTGISLGELDPTDISIVDADGNCLSGRKPTKEMFLHLAVYHSRASNTDAVVHTHSTHSVAWSICCKEKDDSCLPPVTAYQMMRCGEVPLIPYFPPGDIDLAKAVGKVAAKHWSMLLAAHGPVVAGKDIRTAVHALEELEETSRILLLLEGKAYRTLTKAQVRQLEELYPN